MKAKALAVAKQKAPRIVDERTLEVQALRALDRMRVFGTNDSDAPVSKALQKRLAERGAILPAPPLRTLRCGNCNETIPPGVRTEGQYPRCDKCVAGARAVEPPAVFEPLTVSEKALVSRVYGYMATGRLVDLLNERRRADRGANAALVTADQVQSAVESQGLSSSSSDFVTLRKLIREAERDGTLALINEQVILDFAVVFQISAKQLINLQDALLKKDAE